MCSGVSWPVSPDLICDAQKTHSLSYSHMHTRALPSTYERAHTHANTNACTWRHARLQTHTPTVPVKAAISGVPPCGESLRHLHHLRWSQKTWTLQGTASNAQTHAHRQTRQIQQNRVVLCMVKKYIYWNPCWCRKKVRCGFGCCYSTTGEPRQRSEGLPQAKSGSSSAEKKTGGLWYQTHSFRNMTGSLCNSNMGECTAFTQKQNLLDMYCRTRFWRGDTRDYRVCHRWYCHKVNYSTK